MLRICCQNKLHTEEENNGVCLSVLHPTPTKINKYHGPPPDLISPRYFRLVVYPLPYILLPSPLNPPPPPPPPWPRPLTSSVFSGRYPLPASMCLYDAYTMPIRCPYCAHTAYSLPTFCFFSGVIFFCRPKGSKRSRGIGWMEGFEPLVTCRVRARGIGV